MFFKKLLNYFTKLLKLNFTNNKIKKKNVTLKRIITLFYYLLNLVYNKHKFNVFELAY